MVCIPLSTKSLSLFLLITPTSASGNFESLGIDCHWKYFYDSFEYVRADIPNMINIIYYLS